MSKGKLQWSGIANDYTVEYLDGSQQQVHTTMADAFVWERIEKRPLSGGDPPGLTGVLRLIWLALRRTGNLNDPDFKGWAATVADFGAEDEDDEDDEGDEGDGESGEGDLDPT